MDMFYGFVKFCSAVELILFITHWACTKHTCILLPHECTVKYLA